MPDTIPTGFKLLEKLLSTPVPLTSSLKTTYLFPIIFSIRLLNALTIRTFFQADEYWQSLEPAYYLVYGYGYLTWEWKEGIRSFLHPLLYSMIYKFCKVLELNHELVLNLPKVLNALFCTIGEVYLYGLIKKISGDDEVLSRLCLVLSLGSSFNWFCYSRSFSNCLELTLTISALYYFPFGKIGFTVPGVFKGLLLAGISCIIRPTNGILWLLFGYKALYNHQNESLLIIGLTILAGFITIGFDSIVNYWFYGYWNLPIVKFLEFNVTKKLSSFYGISRLDFYFLQAIPILLLSYLPFFLYGLYVGRKRFSDIKIVSVLYIVLFSMIQHKEFRFIYPLMPFLLTFTALGFIQVFKATSTKTTKVIMIFVAALNTIMSFYFTIYHESGVIQITEILRNKVLSDIRELNNNNNNTSTPPVQIGFLTPCHSTPFQSYFQLSPDQANIWFLTCDPPLQFTESDRLQDYMDESDWFYDNPELFLDSNFPQLNKGANTITKSPRIKGEYPHEWPDYIVIFEHLEPFMTNYLKGSNYIEIERVFNSRFHWDHRRTGDVIVYGLK